MSRPCPWPAEPRPAQPLFRPVRSHAQRSPWLVQTKVSLAHCQPTIGQSCQCLPEITASPVNAQPSQWPAEPFAALAMATQNLWSGQTMAQPSPCPALNMAISDNCQANACAALCFHSQTKPNPAQTSQWAAQPLDSPALARAAHNHTSTCPAKNMTCSGQHMSSAYYGQHSPRTEQTRPRPVKSTDEPAPLPALPIASTARANTRPCPHEAKIRSWHGQLGPLPAQFMAKPANGQHSPKPAEPTYSPAHAQPSQ
jgi:hypothetical protein